MPDPIFTISDGKVAASFSSRHSNNMSLHHGDTSRALDSRRDFLGNLGIDYKELVCAKQCHASNIKYAVEEDRGKGAFEYEASIEATDAFITDKKNLPLAVFTADCLSVFLYDPITPAIGLVHAGWRSSKEKLAQKTIKQMQAKFNTKPSSLYVGFGPSIRNCCCEVAENFNDFFPQEVSLRQGRYYLDLAKVNKRQAQEAGVKETNIKDCRICTVCSNDDFFSFRREGERCGRMLSVIMLNK